MMKVRLLSKNLLKRKQTKDVEADPGTYATWVPPRSVQKGGGSHTLTFARARFG